MNIIPQIATRRTFQFGVAILLFFSALWSFFWNQPSTVVFPLQLDQPAQGTLTQHQVASYRLSLETEKYCHIAIVADSNFRGNLIDTTGASILDFSCGQNGKATVSWIATRAGIYQLNLWLDQPHLASERYRIKVEEIRDPRREDQDQVAAESAFAAAERLLRDGNEGAYHEAIKQYERALRLYQAISRSQEEATTLKAIGDAHFLLGEWKTARIWYQESLQVSLRTNNLISQADAHNGISQTSSQLGDASAAKGHYLAALQLSEASVYHYGKAQALTNRAIFLSRAGKPQEALVSCNEALTLWREIGNQQGQGRIHQRMGLSYIELGEPDKARDSYQQALMAFQFARDRNGEAFILTLLGHLYSMIGEKQAALTMYERAQPLVIALGNRTLEGSLTSGKGYFYEEFGDIKKALLYREKAVIFYQAVQDQRNAAMAMMQLGRLHHAEGNEAQALAHINEAHRIVRSIGDRMLETHALKDLGKLAASRGNWQEAFRHYQKAFLLSNKNSDLRWRPYLLNDLGQVAQQLGQRQLARSHYFDALELNRKNNDRVGEAQTYVNLAQLEYAQGNLDPAQAHIAAAANIMESFRSQVTNHELRVTYFAAMHKYFELYTQILMQRFQQEGSITFAAAALTNSERFRARSWLELLHESRYNIKQGADPNLLASERTLQQTLNGKANHKLLLTNQPGKEAELTAVTKEVDDLTTQLDEIRSKIRETSPRYAALTQPQPLKADEIQQLLDDDTMLLEYALGDERSYLWAVTRHSIEAFTLPNRATIEPLAHDLLKLLTAPAQSEEESAAQWQARLSKADQDYWPHAAELSQMLLGPVAAELGKQRLIIVGDGVLQRLPFAALPKPVVGGRWSVVGQNSVATLVQPTTDHQPPITNHQSPTTDHRPPLIIDHEITHLPSASSLKLLREDRARAVPPAGWWARWSQSLRAWWNGNDETASPSSVAVLADPVFGLDDKRVKHKEANAATTNQALLRDVDLSNENLYLPRLAATREEAAGIQRAAGTKAVLLKQGFEVNRSLLESEALQSYSILHLATHGYWDSANPELSGIFLSRVDAQGKLLEDGTLRLSDIYNLNLRKELVVLSACETAVGKDIRGEGLVALTRGFMYAGAARVMASLWKVEDSATAAMMKEFYQHLLQEGVSPAAALRQTQITMWQKQPQETPYKWAAFVLQGEYR